MRKLKFFLISSNAKKEIIVEKTGKKSVGFSGLERIPQCEEQDSQWNSVADMISKMPPRLGAAGGSHE